MISYQSYVISELGNTGKESSERFWRGVYVGRVFKGKMRVGGAKVRIKAGQYMSHGLRELVYWTV